AVYSLDHDEQNEGDDQEIDRYGDERAVTEQRSLLLGIGIGQSGLNLARQRQIVIRKIKTAGYCANDRHEDVLDQRRYDGAKGHADDYRYREIDHVSAQGKFLELLEHCILLHERPSRAGGRAWQERLYVLRRKNHPS